LPLQELLERMEDRTHRQAMTRWTSADVEQYLSAKGLEGPAERIVEIADGLPGFVVELIGWLKENDKLGDDLAGLELRDLADCAPDPSDLDVPDSPPEDGERKHAGPDDAERIAHLAARLGGTFPSGLLADLGGFDRDSVDDIFDATDKLFTEVQYAEQLGTWIYRFKSGLLRESVLARHQADEDKETARRVAAFMERFMVPRGFGYITKTLRLYAENGAPQRAAMLRGMALAGDQNQMWPMAHDLTQYFDEVEWPDPMSRTIYMNMVERAINTGEASAAEQLWNQAMAWATERKDRRLEAWLLFAGSRLDYRRQDLYRARERATDAIKLYTNVDDKLKLAELHNHLAMIELSDGNPNAALEQAGIAEESADVAVVKAHAEYVRGLVAKRDKATWKQSVDHFRKANELAGGVGQAQLALEAGLQLGEILLVSGQTKQSAEVLARVGQIAQSVRNPVKERAAAALLGQAHAALKNFEAALQFGERALQLTRELKYAQLEPIDLYNVGFFNLMLGRSKEAVSLFRQSRKGSDPANVGFQKELLYNLGAALLKDDEVQEAEEAFKAAIQPATQVKDFRKLAGAQQQLAEIAGNRGDNDAARALLYKAMEAAEAGNLRDERKAIKKQLASLGA
jgi:tetratricopeptide (TPR) repeat protein